MKHLFSSRDLGFRLKAVSNFAHVLRLTMDVLCAVWRALSGLYFFRFVFSGRR